MGSYADYTYNSRNYLKRFSHRKRFKNSAETIDLKKGLRILDFGCGDGVFLNQLKITFSEKDLFLIGYEPYLEAIPDNNVIIKQNWDDILEITKKGSFDYVTCFEVLEHFSEKRQIETLQKIANILSEEGLLIISVPIETGFPSIVKNMIRRMDTKKYKHIYSFKNIMRSFSGLPLPAYREGDDYLFHMGFYYKDLEILFQKYFRIETRFFSPFKCFGHHLNSQVFYQLKKK